MNKIRKIIFLIITSFTTIIEANAQECSNERFRLNSDQIAKINNAWGGALLAHKEKLQLAFERYKPNNYQGFAKYKVTDWLPKLNRNKSKMDCGWKKFGWPLQTDYQETRLIISAMTHLNTVSIKIQSYLKTHKQDDLEYIQSTMEEIGRVANKYQGFQPKLNN